MEAQRRNARALRFKHSQSLASLLHRFSQATIRSTIQRFGKTTNAFAGMTPRKGCQRLEHFQPPG